MMRSLKAFIPAMAARLLLTPDALYERQRVLVRDGVLKAVAGRGPGSGVPLTPEAAAALLISMMASDSLSDAAKPTAIFANLVPSAGQKRCFLTGAQKLVTAIGRVIAGRTEEPIGDFELRRDLENATLWSADNNKGMLFVQRPPKRAGVYGLKTTVKLPGAALREISKQFLKHTDQI